MSRARDTANTQDNIGGPTAPYVAGKNAVINGGFDIWQRGTSFTATNDTLKYAADRWNIYNGRTGTTYSQQASGLTGFTYALRTQRDSGNSTTTGIYLTNTFETQNSLRFAGQTVTLSFYARAGANYSASGNVLTANIYYGTGTDQIVWSFTGSTIAVSTNVTLTTSWQRFTVTASIPSTATEVAILYAMSPTGTAGANDYFDLTGVQLEQGSIATPFSRAGGSIGGELALCQRYYWRQNATGVYSRFSNAGTADSTTFVSVYINNPVPMRVVPTSFEYSNLTLYGGAFATLTSPALLTESTQIQLQIGCTGTGLTQYRAYNLLANNTTSSYVGFSAEL